MAHTPNSALSGYLDGRDERHLVVQVQGLGKFQVEIVESKCAQEALGELPGSGALKHKTWKKVQTISKVLCECHAPNKE